METGKISCGIQKWTFWFLGQGQRAFSVTLSNRDPNKVFPWAELDRRCRSKLIENRYPASTAPQRIKLPSNLFANSTSLSINRLDTNFISRSHRSPAIRNDWPKWQPGRCSCAPDSIIARKLPHTPSPSLAGPDRKNLLGIYEWKNRKLIMKNTIRDGGSKALYTVFTVYTIQTTYTVACIVCLYTL